MPKPYGEDSSTSQLSHWIDRAVQAEFRAEKFETALSKEVLAVIRDVLKAEFDRLTKEAAYHEMSYKRVVAENRRLSERIDELEANRP